MSTKDKDKSEKLATGRRKLRRFQSRQQGGDKKKLNSELLSLPTPESNALLVGVPELTAPLPSSLPPASLPPEHSISLHLTTPTPLPVANGYANNDGWSLAKRPLTPPGDPLSLETSQHSSLGDSELGDNSLQTQTIDILVAEKTSLQSEVHTLQSELRHKKREVEDLRSHLGTTRLQLEENERRKLTVSEERNKLENVLLEERRTREESDASLVTLRTTLEDTRQENTELISKVTGQAAELVFLQKSNADLCSQLSMTELLNQQLSSSPEAGGEGVEDRLEELHGEVGRLERVVRSVSGERDQALGDIDALREAMIQQKQDSTKRLSELDSRLTESEAGRLALSDQLSHLSQRQHELAQHASSEHAQYQQSTQVAMETLEEEKQQLQTQLQLQLAERERLCRCVGDLEKKLEEGEREGERLREGAVDSRALLETMSRDKEALSRAVAQNRELKIQLAELQDGFVRLSQQNMELASDLETERFRVARLQKVEKEREAEVGAQTSHDGEGTVCEVGTQTTAAGEEEEERQEINRLSHQLQEVKEVRENLRLQLEEVVRERDRLSGEISQLRTSLPINIANDRGSPLDEAANYRGSSTDNDRGSPTDTEAANQTLDILSALQANFNALQERYVAVMLEKAELLEEVEQREVTIGQLSGETETIGEYIMLYQAQRDALRSKFKEKDTFIQRLISEKEAVQAQLVEVQGLMKQLVTDRTSEISSKHEPSPPPPHTSLPPPPPSSLTPHSPSSLPPPSPSSLPLHLRPFTRDHHITPSPPPPPHHPTTTDTVDRIFQLLSVMGEGGERGRSEAVPCACCSGDVITL